MSSNKEIIEAIHSEMQELEAEYKMREKDIIEIFDLIEDLRERL